MKLLSIAALAAVAILSSGCSGCSTTPDLNKPVLGQTVVDEKALYAAEAALFGANTAAEAAVDAGILKPGSLDAIKVADYLQTAKAALDAGRAAYRLGDAGTFAAKIGASQTLIAQAWALIPAKKG